MFQTRTGFVCLLAAYFAMPFSAPAQWSGSLSEPQPVHGEVDCSNPKDLQVRLEGLNRGGSFRTILHDDGRFEFERVPGGLYQFSVTNAQGNVLHTELVAVREGQSGLRVRMSPASPAPRPAGGGGLISIERLQHRTSGQARKDLNRARKAIEHNDPKRAVVHLEDAVRRDAGCADAWDLLALALLKLGRGPEAETAAREAIRADSSAAKSRYLLGLALMMQRKYGAETLTNLQFATESIPAAHLAAADVLARQGQRESALAELRLFAEVSAPLKPEVREQVDSWISRLRESADGGIGYDRGREPDR